MVTKTLLKTKMEVHTAFLMSTALVCGIIVAGAFGTGMMAGLLPGGFNFSMPDLSQYVCPTGMTVDNYTSNCSYVGTNEGCNLSQKGTIRYFSSRTNSWTTTSDFCVNIGSLPGMPSINQIAEFDCQNGKKAYYTTNCPSGKSCVDGACMIPCVNSDVSTSTPDGRNYEQQGTISGQDSSGVAASGTDSCVGSQIKEYYCSNNIVTSETVPCPTGKTCQNGACVSIPCTDSDVSSEYPNGRNYLTQGTISGVDSSSAVASGTDSCVGGQIKEYYCSNNLVISETINCPSGKMCENGACITAINYDPEVSCKLQCGNLCYNNSNEVICVDGVAWLKGFNPSHHQLLVSEQPGPKAYALNSVANKTLILNNNLGRSVNALVTIIFKPFALVNQTLDLMEPQRTIINNRPVSMQVGETTQITVPIPTDTTSMSAQFQTFIWDADNREGISNSYFSNPFTIYNPSRSKITCHEYITNTDYPYSYLCTPKYYIPLGTIGCRPGQILGNGKICGADYYAIYPYQRIDRFANNVKILFLSAYLQSDASVIDNEELMLSNELNLLVQKFNSISNDLNVSNTIQVDQKKCSASPAAIRAWLNTLRNTDSSPSIFTSLSQLCNINTAGYTHFDMNFPMTSLSDSDRSLIQQKAFGGILAAAIYAYDGVIHSSLTSGNWRVILHEITHSFGAPDIFMRDDPAYQDYGKNYIWGDCYLMGASGLFDMDTTLCPLEAAYYKNY
ncbi:MAG: hypothetical protein AAB358_00050 [Patescibacteria group bacterium]|mgnify:CR=1 FL=1